MVFNLITQLLETRTEHLAARWAEDLRESEYTRSYAQLPEDELRERHARVIESLTRWLEEEFSRRDAGHFFVAVGRERYQEGLPLAEAVYALLLGKSGLWKLVLEEGVLENAAEVYQALKLITQINNFFDLGNFYITRGYMEKMYSDMEENAGLPQEELQKYFFPGSFFKDEFAEPPAAEPQ